MNNKIDIVCPLAEKDVDQYIKGLDSLKKHLDVKSFVVIGNDNVRKKIDEYKKYSIKFVDENSLISFSSVKDIISKRSSDEKAIKRTGWYLQQFLKISYSLVCEDEYYILWDADTIPIHKHEMIQNDHLIFDMKTEHHEPYFKTFSRLFPNYTARNELSYISEHMIIKTDYMRELISEIAASSVIGATWYEKIINSIDDGDLPFSGFADYETYGLFCLNKYPSVYIERRWDSLRPASSFFVYEKMRDCDYEWISKDYDAVSFEASRKLKKYMNVICRNKFVQKHFSCKKLLKSLHQFTI